MYLTVTGKLRSEYRGMGDLNLLKPYAVFEQLFEQKIRIEDRDCLEFADINVAAGVLTSCHGSALVKVGKTQVIAGVKVHCGFLISTIIGQGNSRKRKLRQHNLQCRVCWSLS